MALAQGAPHARELPSFHVKPGHSVGGFVLGSPIAQIIDFLKANVRTIQNIDLKYGDENPLALDYVIHLTNDGIQLRFDAASQRLKMIDITDVTKIQLSYSGTCFSAPGKRAPTFVTVYRLFGPSHPGDYDKHKQMYTLHYPGLSFFFPIPQQYAHLLSGRDNSLELPMEFPDGTTPVTTRICVYGGADVRAPLVPAPLPDDLYFEVVRVHAGVGVELMGRRRRVCFGDTCQDVMASLGVPDKVYFKGEDKMRIHAAKGSRGADGNASSFSNGSVCSDYFFNYFTCGLDILFDATHHTVKKVVLRTNFPTHADFNMYYKCNFRVYGSGSGGGGSRGSRPGVISKAEFMKKQQPQQQDSGEGAATATAATTAAAAAASTAGEAAVITPDSKWAAVQECLGAPLGKPVIFTRGGTTANPFGATRFYGYRNMVFEIMKNGHIASLILHTSD